MKNTYPIPSQRAGINEVEVAADDFGEGVLSAVARVAGEQFQIGVAHVTSISLLQAKPDKEN